MDPTGFDVLTRAAAGSSRRSVLRSLAGAALGAAAGLLGLNRANAACGRVERPCSDTTPCCDGARCVRGTCRCSGGLTVCRGLCKNLKTNHANCGACGERCAAGKVCRAGRCACVPDNATACAGKTCGEATNNCGQTVACGPPCGCPNNGRECGGVCVDPLTDPANCGTCGNLCLGGLTCQNGRCVCAAGGTICNGVCRTLASDVNHCGRCNNACPVPAGGAATCNGGVCGEGCVGGRPVCADTCVDVATDPNHCGRCGNRCASGICAAGGCAENGAKFRVTVEGFKVWDDTWDTAFGLDGQGDEVWVRVDRVWVDAAGAARQTDSIRTENIGDINGHPSWIQGGTATDKGGFKTGDVFPAGFRTRVPTNRAPTSNSLPLHVGDFDMRRGQNGFAFIPSIWEWDGDGLLWWNGFVNAIPAIGAAAAYAVSLYFGLVKEADKIAGLTKAILEVPLQQVGTPGDRPIGIHEQGDGKGTLPLKALLLDYEGAKAFSNFEQGLASFVFQDLDKSGRGNGGYYELVMRVQYLEPLWT